MLKAIRAHLQFAYGCLMRLCAGAVVNNQGSKDANPAIINVGDNDGLRSPSRGRPGGGRGGVGTRLVDVVLEHPSPLGPTSARLRWDVNSVGAAQKRNGIDGFHVKYRPVLDAERGPYFCCTIVSKLSVL